MRTTYLLTALLLASLPAAAATVVDQDFAIDVPVPTWRLSTNDSDHPIELQPWWGRVRMIELGDGWRAVSMVGAGGTVFTVSEFTAEFTFSIEPEDLAWEYGEGLVFFIGASDDTYLGGSGAHMGWGGPGNIFPGIAVEVDTRRDGDEEYESWSENHIGVAYLPDGNGDQAPRSAYIANPRDFGFPDFEGSGPFTARLEFACGRFALALLHDALKDDLGNRIPVYVLEGTFPFFQSFEGRPGFTAGTGDASSCMSIHTVRIETPPVPSCEDRTFTFPIRINAGGTSYVDPGGNRWDTDMLLGPHSPLGIREGGGYAGANRMPIEGTDADRIYQSERWGDSTWTFHVPDGRYTVILHWSESWAPGVRRMFGVYVEELAYQTVEEFSPVRASGAMYAACQRTFIVNVQDGDGLAIVFLGYPWWLHLNAKISAIEIHQGAPPGTILPVARTVRPIRPGADLRIVANGPGAIDTNGYIKAWLLFDAFSQTFGAAPSEADMRSLIPFGLSARELAIADGSLCIFHDCQISTRCAANIETPITRNWYACETVVFLWVDDDDGISFDDVYIPDGAPDNVNDAYTYAVAYVGYDGRAGDSLPITIGVSSDDSILVRVNGVEALIRSVERGWGDPATVQDRGDAVLEKGMNVIMAKVFEGSGGFGFRLRLEERGAGKALTANDGISVHEYYYPPIVTITSGRDRILPGEMETFHVSVLGAVSPLVEWDFNAADGLYVEAIGETVSRTFPEEEWPTDRTIVVTASVTVGQAVTTVQKRIVAAICELSDGWVADEPDPLVWIDEPHHLGRGLEGAGLEVAGGKLHVTLPRGVDYDSWTDFDYAPKLLIPLSAFSDFAIETRVTEVSRDPGNQLQSGLGVVLDETGYVPRPGYLFYGIIRDEIALDQSGSEIPPATQPGAWAAQGAPPYATSLRLEKLGTEYRFSYRLSDAEPWTLQLTRAYGGSARHAGVVAKNWGLTAGEFVFDYLHFQCIEPPPPAPEIEVSPLVLAFGDVTAGTTKLLTATIRNLGTADLDVSSVDLGVGSSTTFTITAGGGSRTILPGGQSAVDVRYRPIAPVQDAGTLVISSNDPDEGAITVVLSGRGVVLGTFRRGDSNASGGVDIADAVFLLGHLFAKGPAPSCKDAGDANDDGKLDIADAIAILSHLFAHTGPLNPPFGQCGVDPPPEDALDCSSFPPCAGP